MRGIACLALLSLAHASFANEGQSRPFTVRDSIEMSRVVPIDGQTAAFSPDASRFVLHTVQGDLRQNASIERLLLFENMAGIYRHRTLAQFATTRDAARMSSIQWLGKREVGFIAQSRNDTAQVFAADVDTGAITQLTHSRSDVATFAAASDLVAYYSRTDATPRQAVIVRRQPIYELICPDTAGPFLELSVASRSTGEVRRMSVQATRLAEYFRRIWISPAGAYAITLTPAVDALAHWAQYKIPHPDLFGFAPDRVESDPTSTQLLSRLRYLFVDLRTGAAKPLLDAPLGNGSLAATPIEVFWAEDERSVIVTNTFLPLRPAFPERRAAPATAKVDLSSGKVTPTMKPSVREMPKIMIRQTLHERPRVFIGGDVTPVYDPDPQLDRFAFGSAESFVWQDAHGIDWQGSVIAPTRRPPGERIPLVVQTHGFQADEFLIDGPYGIATAFAAQPLANAGIMVLQAGDNTRAETLDEHEGPQYAEGFRAAIEKLVSTRRADPARIGYIGWSRTGYHALHLLAKHPHLLAAATIADSAQLGYASYIFGVNDSRDYLAQFEKATGGSPLVGSRDEWMRRNPLYQLAPLATPIRLETIGSGSLLGMWETFALLRYAHVPVDMIYFPQGSHDLMKPRERFASQGGNVDWFRFWLQGYEDPDPLKSAQYRAWRSSLLSTNSD